MTDVATDLRERFDFAIIWFYERYEVLPDGQSVTPHQIYLLVHGVQVVGFGFAPTTATEFLEVLNRTVQRDMAQA